MASVDSDFFFPEGFVVLVVGAFQIDVGLG
jgi:hypothetical protein